MCMQLPLEIFGEETVTDWCSGGFNVGKLSIKTHGCRPTSNSLMSSCPKQVSHAQEDPVECDDLSDEFTLRSSPPHLSTPVRRKHNDYKGSGKSLHERSLNNGHDHIHTKGKLCECPLCGKAFSNGLSLRRHKRAHNGE